MKEFTSLVKRGSSKLKAFAYLVILVARVSSILKLSVKDGETINGNKRSPT